MRTSPFGANITKSKGTSCCVTCGSFSHHIHWLVKQDGVVCALIAVCPRTYPAVDANFSELLRRISKCFRIADLFKVIYTTTHCNNEAFIKRMTGEFWSVYSARKDKKSTFIRHFHELRYYGARVAKACVQV